MAITRTLALDTLKHVGIQVKLQGWVDTIRDHGKLVFIELRDRSGKVQVIGDKTLGDLHNESVVEVTGTVQHRPDSMINPDHPTGTVEITLDTLTVLNACKEVPFPIDTDGKDIGEEIRLKYRYLDLRRPRLSRAIKLRNRYIKTLRDALYAEGFTEVETPMLTKSTKEGARDFVVPSRFQPGKFYALPQSPQQYKQLLMTAGVERYMQFARCIRDEDLRADRGFEHTQVDLEMSFMNQEEVMVLVEAVVKHAVQAVGGKLKDQTFPVVDYATAMQTYGADRFDLRSESEKQAGVLAFAWVVNFPFFKRVDKGDMAEVRDGKSGWTFTHNPFSQPKPEHLEWHLKGEHIDQIITQQYDLVCNGFEVGGGSIRAYNPDVLRQTFKIMGYSEAEIEASIGHMLTAFALGTPPHGGIALGLDRHVMLLAHEMSLKEVIAFPMTSTGRTAVMDAPTDISQDQLKELGIAVRSAPSLGTTDRRSVLDQIQTWLNAEGVSYQTSAHEKVITSEDAARVRKVPLVTGAKALVAMADAKPVMIVVSAVDKLHLGSFKKTYGIKDLALVDKPTLTQLTTLEPGAIPPFGSLFTMPTYVDEHLTQQAVVNFNAGSHTVSMQIDPKDYLRLEKPIIGQFAQG